MKNSWIDRTDLKTKIMEARKQHFLSCLLDKELTVQESGEIIEKIIHCNKILFDLKMYEKNENSYKSE